MYRHGISRDEIMEIAERKGYFFVHRHRYRHDRLRNQCRRLANEGRLYLAPAWAVKKRFRDDPRTALYYIPTKEAS